MIRKLNRVLYESADSDMYIDMWYDDEYDPEKHYIDVRFYPNDAEYRGNIYRKRDNKAVGDFSCSDSVEIERTFGKIKWESFRRTKRRSIRERIEATPEMIQDFSDIYSLINKRLSNRGYKVKREGVADNTWLAIRVFRGAEPIYDDFIIDMENLENIVNQLLFRTGYAQDYEVFVGNVDGKSYNIEISPR